MERFKELIAIHKDTQKFSDKIKMHAHGVKIGMTMHEPIMEEDVLKQVISLEAKCEELDAQIRYAYDMGKQDKEIDKLKVVTTTLQNRVDAVKAYLRIEGNYNSDIVQLINYGKLKADENETTK